MSKPLSFVSSIPTLSTLSKLSASGITFVNRNHSYSVRSHILSPVFVGESTEEYNTLKEKSVYQVWKYILNRKRNPITYQPKKGELPIEEEKNLIHPHNHAITLGRIKANNIKAFKTHVYHAIRFDRPDLIISMNKHFSGSEKAFLARAYISKGDLASAQQILSELEKMKNLNALQGVISILIALGRHKDAKKKLSTLSKFNTGSRKYFYELVASPFYSEIGPMLDFARLISDSKPSVAALLRIHVIRALIHKHQMIKAVNIFKQQNSFLKDSNKKIDKFNIAFKKISKVLGEYQSQSIKKTIEDIKASKTNGEHTEKLYEQLEKQWEEYSKIFSKGSVLNLFYKNIDVTAPLIRKIITQGSDQVVRQYFRINYRLVVEAFGDEHANQLEEILVRSFKSLKEYPQFSEIFTRIRFYIARKDFEKAFGLYKDNIETIKKVQRNYYRIIPGLMVVRKNLLALSPNPEETLQLFGKSKKIAKESL